MGQRFRTQSVQQPVAVASLRDEACGEENGEMTRDGGGRHVEPPGDLPRRQLPIAQVLEDLAAGRVDQGTKDGGAHDICI